MSIDPNDLLIKDCEIYSEIITFEVDNHYNLKIYSSGQIGEFNEDLDIGYYEEQEFNDSSKTVHSSLFIKTILKIREVTDELYVHLKTDEPSKFHFILKDGGELISYLAPRPEEVDFDEDDIDDNEYADVSTF